MLEAHLLEKLRKYTADIRSELVEDWKSLVRIKSVSVAQGGEYPFGEGCAQVLERALCLAERHGFQSENCGNWYGMAKYGAGRRQIGIFSHLDVVEEGDGWLYPPYEPTEKEGWLIGRGAGDNKSAAVLGLYVMRALRELELPIQSQVMLYFGCNEEKGMLDIDRFVAEQPMPDCSMVPDLFFPVCHGEKGGVKVHMRTKTPMVQILEISGGEAENMVPDKARARLRAAEGLLERLTLLAGGDKGITVVEAGGEILVTAQGKSAMSSMPEGGINAVALLSDFLSQAEGMAAEDGAILSSLATLSKGHDGRALGLVMEDPPSGSLTCVCTKAETRQGHAELHFNIRYPVTAQGDDVIATLQERAAAMGMEICSLHHNAGYHIPVEHPYVQMLCGIHEEVSGVKKEPYAIGGGTYARKLKRAVAFGAGNGSKNPFLPQGHGGVHQPDESRPIDAILEAVVVYVAAIVHLDGLDEAQWLALWP